MHLGTIKLGGDLTFTVNTHAPATGAAVAADAAPGYRVYEDETAVPLLTGSMAALDGANTTGFYSEEIAVTAANGFEVGRSYSIRITGVVGGVTGVEIHTFAVDSVRVSDVKADTAEIGVKGAGLTALGDARLAHLDVDVSSRSAPGDAMALTAAAVDAIIDETIEGTITMRQLLRILLAVMAGLASGGGTNTIRYRDLADVLDRVVMTVDAMGNRTHVTLNGA